MNKIAITSKTNSYKIKNISLGITLYLKVGFKSFKKVTRREKALWATLLFCDCFSGCDSLRRLNRLNRWTSFSNNVWVDKNVRYVATNASYNIYLNFFRFVFAFHFISPSFRNQMKYIWYFYTKLTWLHAYFKWLNHFGRYLVQEILR